MKWLRESWAFLKKDSWASFGVTLILAFIFIKFVFFPGLSLVTGTSLPLVIVESCSMYHHPGGWDKIISSSPVYKNNRIGVNDTFDWIFPRGFSKGDVIFVVGAKNIEIGDVIIFNAGSSHPLIHRVVSEGNTYSTKGDNYITNTQQLSSEMKIEDEQIIGKALFKVPGIGWAKLLFFERGRAVQDRGFC